MQIFSQNQVGVNIATRKSLQKYIPFNGSETGQNLLNSVSLRP
jgi:hypothetical protein